MAVDPVWEPVVAWEWKIAECRRFMRHIPAAATHCRKPLPIPRYLCSTRITISVKRSRTTCCFIDTVSARSTVYRWSLQAMTSSTEHWSKSLLAVSVFILLTVALIHLRISTFPAMAALKFNPSGTSRSKFIFLCFCKQVEDAIYPSLKLNCETAKDFKSSKQSTFRHWGNDWNNCETFEIFTCFVSWIVGTTVCSRMIIEFRISKSIIGDVKGVKPSSCYVIILTSSVARRRRDSCLLFFRECWLNFLGWLKSYALKNLCEEFWWLIDIFLPKVLPSSQNLPNVLLKFINEKTLFKNAGFVANTGTSKYHHFFH